jgi:preprotein translocase subunit SecA
LMRIFAGDFVKSLMIRMGMKEGEAIESSMVTRRIAGAQKKVEERHFEWRKNVLEYDEVMDEQRKRVYRYRQAILDGQSCRTLIVDQVRQQVDRQVDVLVSPTYGAESFAAWAGSKLACTLEGRDFKNTDFSAADLIAKDQAERHAELALTEAIEENLPVGDEEEEWNWQALATWINNRFKTSYRDRDLKKIGRDNIHEEIYAKAQQWIAEVDLKEGAVFLEGDFGLRSLVAWMRAKYGVDVNIESLKGKEPDAIKKVLGQAAEETYANKERDYPLLTGIYRFTRVPPNGSGLMMDVEGMRGWLKDRFNAEVMPEQLMGQSREMLRQNLSWVGSHATTHLPNYDQQGKELVDAVFSGGPGGQSAQAASNGTGSLDSLATWMQNDLHSHHTKEKLGLCDQATLEKLVQSAVDDRLQPEIRKMERAVLLNIVDEAWKGHLLAMDHLRSSVGLKGYAQIDPKVEYKREGMRLFDKMWESVGERVTDLVFRMENLNADFVSSTWVKPVAHHDSPPSLASNRSVATPPANGRNDEEGNTPRGSAVANSPPANRGVAKVGRNDPCPCGSGKRYKSCCMPEG